jgi:transcriptional regulator with XRE-family HTH domain
LLKRLREEREITQEELALAVGLHPSVLPLIERGSVRLSWETVTNITKAMGISFAELGAHLERPAPPNTGQAMLSGLPVARRRGRGNDTIE